MRSMRLNHVALTVSDVDRSAAFYERHFGFERRLHDDPEFVMLAQLDGSMLALTAGEPPVEPGRFFHFGVQVESAEDVHRARRDLASAGITETEWDVEDDGHCRVQVEDPDGFRVEVFNA
jgi:catechol 2,3-dioxygenase-like lactoylglutathione lyase family enzyme